MNNANPTPEAIDQDHADIERWFALQSKKVQRNARVVSGALARQTTMLHIDKNPVAVFTPMMPRSAMPSEDNTTARVTVAPSVLGCYVGYYRAHDDFIKGAVVKPGAKDPYRGGYIIHQLDFVHCLAPNAVLVPDAERSAEHWLVPYNQASLEYTSREVGKMFVTEVLQKANTQGEPSTELTLYLECTVEQGFLFSPTLRVGAGYHCAKVLWSRGVKETCFVDNDIALREVDAAQYMAAKQLSANLLSRTEPSQHVRPSYTQW
jgi:hypothetical protein